MPFYVSSIATIQTRNSRRAWWALNSWNTIDARKSRHTHLPTVSLGTHWALWSRLTHTALWTWKAFHARETLLALLALGPLKARGSLKRSFTSSSLKHFVVFVLYPGSLFCETSRRTASSTVLATTLAIILQISWSGRSQGPRSA